MTHQTGAFIRAFQGKAPRIAEGAFIAHNATLIGDIEIAEDASVWYGVVLRADVGSIRIGKRTNVQDLACLHMTIGMSHAIVGDDVTLGHGCIVHGATIGDGCLIGMGALVLDNAEVGAESLVAAGTVITPRTVIPPRSLVRGQPGQVIRTLRDDEWQMGRLSALHYVDNAREHARL